MKVGSHHNQSSEQDYVKLIARHLPKLRIVKLERDPISVGIDPVKEFPAVLCRGVRNVKYNIEFSHGNNKCHLHTSISVTSLPEQVIPVHPSAQGSVLLSQLANLAKLSVSVPIIPSLRAKRESF
jgi:hypothetical protein